MWDATDLPYTNEVDTISGIPKFLADNGISVSNVVGLYHTHPASSTRDPSDTDIKTANINNFPVFVMHKNGLTVYDPVTKTPYDLRENMDWVKSCPP
jgi:proteasome lid subunit RPN8/RPN11